MRYSEEMNRLGCPHLVRETVTYRESLDLSRAAPTRVMVNWYCGHPFHGIRLDLGRRIARLVPAPVGSGDAYVTCGGSSYGGQV